MSSVVSGLSPDLLRVTSYNIRKAVGTDRRRDPARILRVIAETGAEIVLLQEADLRLPPRRPVLDPVAMGTGFVAYMTVGLSQHTKAAQVAFERAVARAPEVREVHNITGTREYLLRVEAADLAAYKHFHTDVLGVLPQVNAITTYVVMDSPKDDRA